MNAPSLIFASKKPFAIRCPACSRLFSIVDYSGSFEEKLSSIDCDYETHFMNEHGAIKD